MGNEASIEVGGKNVGGLSESLVINNDEECLKYLNSFKETLSLTESEKQLIDKCINVLTSKIGTNVTENFGPCEICELYGLSSNYLDKSNEILACAKFLIESVDFEGELPEGIYLEMASLHGMLGNMFYGLDNPSDEESCDNSSDDELFDEDYEENFNKYQEEKATNNTENEKEKEKDN